jgi:NAD+ kinase
MKVVGLVPHRERSVAQELTRAAAAWFRAQGVDVRLPASAAAPAELEKYAVDDATFADGVDLVLSLGGDGTMLNTVQLVYPRPAPIIGVNVGNLAYLSEIEPGELDASLPKLLSGDYDVSERMVLAVEVRSAGPAAGAHFALNEAVLEKQRSGHMIRLDVSINGSAFTSYAADGVIVATPTGTTAYSFSARGPIVSPALRCIALTPISPHMLFDRSLVLAEHEELDFVVCENRPVELTIDGRELGALGDGDRVQCRAAPDPVRFATLRPRDFHQVLKSKFDLPDR